MSLSGYNYGLVSGFFALSPYSCFPLAPPHILPIYFLVAFGFSFLFIILSSLLLIKKKKKKTLAV